MLTDSTLAQAKQGLHVTLPQLADAYGPVYKFFFGRIAIVVISDPDLVKEVQQRCLH